MRSASTAIRSRPSAGSVIASCAHQRSMPTMAAATTRGPAPAGRPDTRATSTAIRSIRSRVACSIAAAASVCRSPSKVSRNPSGRSRTKSKYTATQRCSRCRNGSSGPAAYSLAIHEFSSSCSRRTARANSWSLAPNRAYRVGLVVPARDAIASMLALAKPCAANTAQAASSIWSSVGRIRGAAGAAPAAAGIFTLTPIAGQSNLPLIFPYRPESGPGRARSAPGRPAILTA